MIFKASCCTVKRKQSAKAKTYCTVNSEGSSESLRSVREYGSDTLTSLLSSMNVNALSIDGHWLTVIGGFRHGDMGNHPGRHLNWGGTGRMHKNIKINK